MTKLHYIIASIISIVCLGFIAIHWGCPDLTIDREIVILLAVAILPWLTPFFKRLKIGPVEGETHGRSQGTTTKPLPPQETPAIESEISLSQDAEKILATLWKYQKQTFKDDKIKRWTFRLFPNAPKYVSYLSGVSELLKHGFISIDPKNDQCMLTNEGMDFVEKNTKLQDYQYIYKF